MEKIDLIVADLDGTLLDAKGKISDATKKMLVELKRRGIPFAIATGRPFFTVNPKLNEWGIENLVSALFCSNGNHSFDFIHGKEDHIGYFDPSLIGEIVETYKHFDANPTAYMEDHFVATKHDDFVKRLVAKNNMTVVFGDLVELVNRPIEKVILAADFDVITQMEKFHAENPSPHYRAFRSQKDLFEFMDPRVSKSAAIQAFCDNHGLSMENVVAFGDTGNDVEMVRDAGLGVAMANATPDVLSVAKVIAKHHDDNGVARLVFDLLGESW